MVEQLKIQFHEAVKSLQDQISEEMKKRDPELVMIEDPWERLDHEQKPGGGGRTRAFTGSIFENAGVNTSCVLGAISPEFAQKLGGDSNQMWAAGISLIIHPRNPKVPTVHANFRMIQVGTKVWFGGGADLTPFYPHEEDFHYFHSVWKEACAPYGLYDSMKKTCDEYFVNAHRQGEMRGIGGIFFDHLNTGDMQKDFKMVLDLASYFIKSYFPIVDRRVNESFDSTDEEFQLHRRGRYVEFNLLHDRGTLFGLKTNGRVESILISLPARCTYSYSYRPKPGSPHEKMLSYYRPFKW